MPHKLCFHDVILWKRLLAGILAIMSFVFGERDCGKRSVTATLNELGRALILQALEEAGWMIGGPEGAAIKLGLKRTTLIYKMKKKLGICPTHSGGGRELG